MELLKKGQLPPKVKELIVSKVGNYQAEKLTATLLNGTLAQKADIIKELLMKYYRSEHYKVATWMTKYNMTEIYLKRKY